MWKLLICIMMFLIGYGTGIREGTDSIRLGDLEQILLDYIAVGAGIGIAGVVGYFLLLRHVSNKLSLREQNLEKAKAALQRDKGMFQSEKEERMRALVSMNEEIVEDRTHQELKDALVLQTRRIEAEVEKRYRQEMSRIQGVRHDEEKSLIKHKTSLKTSQTYRASNGKTYARLQEGEPVGK